MVKKRTSEYKINKLILNRWSPRAMSGEAITTQELMTIFEAGRWAPSAYNGQPWKFLYAKKGTKEWDIFYNTFVEFNKSWINNASVLVLIVSNKILFDKDSPTNQFDAGAAWENMALQAYSMKLVIHGMSGFDYDKARTDLEVPNTYDVLAMFAIGKPAPKKTLSKELKKKEIKSDRKPLSEIIVEGKFK